MNAAQFLLLYLGVIFLSGCSSVPVRVDEGRIQANTFSFMEPKGRNGAAYAETRVEIHQVIQAAIARNLAVKGITRVDSGGDVTVGYLVVVGSNVTTTAIGDYFGYGPETRELLDKAAEGADKLREAREKSRIRNANRFLAGALVVDIVDTPSQTLLFRNFAYRELSAPASPEIRARRIEDVVDEVLRDLRVSAAR